MKQFKDLNNWLVLDDYIQLQWEYVWNLETVQINIGY